MASTTCTRARYPLLSSMNTSPGRRVTGPSARRMNTATMLPHKPPSLSRDALITLTRRRRKLLLPFLASSEQTEAAKHHSETRRYLGERCLPFVQFTYDAQRPFHLTKHGRRVPTRSFLLI